MPARPAPSASAAIPPTGASTGSPAARAAVSVGHVSGSTPITRASVAYQAAIPPSSPPPPTAAITVSSMGAWSASSRASVPWPATTAGWSYGCRNAAPVSHARSSQAANASA